MLSINAVETGHAGRRDFSAEGQHIVRVGAEFNMIAGYQALHLAMLIGSAERTGDDVALLDDLNCF